MFMLLAKRHSGFSILPPIRSSPTFGNLDSHHNPISIRPRETCSTLITAQMRRWSSTFIVENRADRFSIAKHHFLEKVRRFDGTYFHDRENN
jgi:hypothetical protein